MKKIYIIGVALATLLAVGAVYADEIRCTIADMTHMLKADCGKYAAEGS